MEECHDLIQDAFPAQELKGLRLLPVVLFRTEEQYVDSYLKINEDSTREQAERTGGSCEGEYYVTWYESTQVRDHVYLASQQFLRNRHWLTGGGSWFRVGFGEYLENSDSERKQFSRVVEKNEFVPLSTFMLMRTFALTETDTDIRGKNTASDLYFQAAALVEFFVESKFAKKRLVEFFRMAGNTSREDRAQLERVLRDVFDTDIEGLEAEFVAYWKKR
jgi:hypothetical protein